MREVAMLSTTVLSEKDLLRAQAACPEGRIELRDGKIVIMSPSGDIPEFVAARLVKSLGAFVEDHRLGYVLTSSAGYRLSSGDILSPDVSFISRERLPKPTGSFISGAPDLAVEIASPSDRLSDLREKLIIFREAGARATLLIDPDAQTVEVGEGKSRIATLRNGATLILEMLPGWSVKISDLWPPEYDLA